MSLSDKIMGTSGEMPQHATHPSPEQPISVPRQRIVPPLTSHTPVHLSPKRKASNSEDEETFEDNKKTKLQVLRWEFTEEQAYNFMQKSALYQDMLDQAHDESRQFELNLSTLPIEVDPQTIDEVVELFSKDIDCKLDQSTVAEFQKYFDYYLVAAYLKSDDAYSYKDQAIGIFYDVSDEEQMQCIEYIINKKRLVMEDYEIGFFLFIKWSEREKFEALKPPFRDSKVNSIFEWRQEIAKIILFQAPVLRFPTK